MRRGALGCGGLFPEGATVAGHPRFVELPLLAFVSSFFSFGLDVLFAPAILVLVLVALKYKAGELFFDKRGR